MKNEHIAFGAYHLKTIDASYVPHMMALQADLVASFSEDQKKFVRHRGEAEMERSVSPENVGVGAFTADGQLVGTFFLVEHSGLETDGTLALCSFTRDYLTKQSGQKLGVLCAAMVHPAHQQQKLMQEMMRFLQEQATRNDYNALVAAVACTNEASIRGFMGQGFTQVGADCADSDGRSLVFLARAVAQPQPVSVLSHRVGSLVQSAKGSVGTTPFLVPTPA